MNTAELAELVKSRFDSLEALNKDHHDCLVSLKVDIGKIQTELQISQTSSCFITAFLLPHDLQCIMYPSCSFCPGLFKIFRYTL